MKQETLTRIEGEFRTFPVMSSGRPAESEWKAELARLDFSPPEDYVEFIRRFGGSIVGSYSIVGLGASSVMGSEEESVSEFTEMFRADGWPGSGDWIVFSKDLAGNPIGFDRDGAVWSWDHDSGEMIQLAGSFELFLVEYCFKVPIGDG